MFLDSEKSNPKERKNNQTEETERKNLTCPECGKEFQDMRGVTSHARHMHGKTKEELANSFKGNNNWGPKILSGIVALILALLTFGKK